MRKLGCVLALGLLVAAGSSALGQTSLTATEGTPKLDGVASPGEWTSDSITTSKGLTIRAMIDDEFLWVLAQWEDATQNVAKGTYTFDGANWIGEGDEDRVAIIWDMGETTDATFTCTNFCHFPEMSTNGGRVDVWHWKAARTNPLGYLDDKWWDIDGRHGDSGSATDSNNNLVDGVPEFISADDPDASVTFLTNDPSALNLANPFGAVGGSFGLAVAHAPATLFSVGAKVPGRILTLPGGSRGDVRAAGKWEDGVWTVEFCRKLVAGDDDFSAIRGTSVQFVAEIFNDEGDDHWQDGYDETTWTLNIPLPTAIHAQFANGGGLTSVGTVSNPLAAEEIPGTVRFLGEDGSPMSVEVISSNQDGVVIALDSTPAHEGELHFHLAPLGALTYSTTGEGEVVVGSAVVTSDKEVSSVVRFNLPGVGVAGVGRSEPVTGFITPVNNVNGVRIGIALHNPGDAAISLTLTLRDEEGNVVPNGIVQDVDIPAHGHLQGFVDELFPDADTTGLVGTLTVEVDGEGLVAGTALEIGSQPGEFTTLPVTPLGR